MIMKISKILFGIVFMLSIFWLSLAQNVNYLDVSPSAWTYKYFCDFNVNIDAVHNGGDYSNCIYHVSFDTGAIGLSYLSRWASFDTHDLDEYLNTNFDVLHVEEQNTAGLLNSSATCSTLRINNKNTSVASTSLEFVDNSFNTPTSNTFLQTNEWLVLNGVWNTLTWVNNATYNFDAAPCSGDINAPVVYPGSLTPSTVNWWQLTGIQDIDMLVIDWQSTNWHYRYSWLDNTNLSNYEEVVGGDNVDNQYWVNSWTLNVKIVNAAGAGTTEYPILTKVAYTWTYTPNKFTWDSVDRWYWIDFTNTNAFEVEKEVIITVTGYDNPNYSLATHLMTRVFTFNTPEKPTMNMTTPINWSTFQNPAISLLKFQTNDSWAGVDTWTIKIEIPVIMSWATQLMTGHIYSGSELSFSLNSGGTGLGDAGWYEISLIPFWDFPSDETVVVSGFVADLSINAVNLSTNNYTDTWTFTTRPSCDFYGCNEILDIYIMEWSHFNGGIPYQFTGELLVATGTNPNSIYPYLTWINNDILMCGFPYTWANITSNFDMYESDWITLLTLPYAYTWTELYITWLDFTYSNGVITVN